MLNNFSGLSKNAEQSLLVYMYLRNQGNWRLGPRQKDWSLTRPQNDIKEDKNYPVTGNSTIKDMVLSSICEMKDS